MVPRGDKREAIMQAAAELFAEQGFHAVTVPTVAKGAGVGAGTLYHYFDSKETLANALYLHYKQGLFEAVARDFPHDLPPRKRFREMFLRFARHTITHPVGAAFLFRNNHSTYLDEAGCAIDSKMQAWLFEFVQRSIDEEAVKDVDAMLHIAVVGGILESLAAKCSARQFQVTDAALEAIEEMAWHAVRR